LQCEGNREEIEERIKRRGLDYGGEGREERKEGMDGRNG
jgi:hypothetical protein